MSRSHECERGTQECVRHGLHSASDGFHSHLRRRGGFVSKLGTPSEGDKRHNRTGQARGPPHYSSALSALRAADSKRRRDFCQSVSLAAEGRLLSSK
jgi:hypothetical protein